MEKSSPKRLENQYNQITSIHRNIKLKQPNKLQQQSSRRTEATKVNATMEQLDKSDGNGYRSKKTSINLHHSMNQTIRKTICTGKTNTPIIVLSEEEKGRKNKGGQNKGNKEDVNGQENKTTAKVYDPDSDDELNGDFRMAENGDNSDNDNKEHIPRAKVRPIKNTKKNKPSSLTFKETSLKVTHTKETNKKNMDEIMDTRHKKEEEK